MQLISRLTVRARAAAHAQAARLPRWARRGLRLGAGPARLDLRLDDLDGVGTPPPRRAGDADPHREGGARPVEEWQGRVVDWFIANGPVPVTVISQPGNPLLAELARFCHRLDVPVTVRTVAEGLGKRQAEDIVDAGARRVVVSGATPAALGEVARARASRHAKVDIEAEVPANTTLEEARGLVTAGADGVRVALGWRGALPGPYPLRGVVASFSRTPHWTWSALDALGAATGEEPGTPRTSGRCPAGARVVLDAAGACSCPWKLGRVDRAGGWAALDLHRGEIAACSRECWHPEVA